MMIRSHTTGPKHPGVLGSCPPATSTLLLVRHKVDVIISSIIITIVSISIAINNASIKLITFALAGHAVVVVVVVCVGLLLTVLSVSIIINNNNSSIDSIAVSVFVDFFGQIQDQKQIQITI